MSPFDKSLFDTRGPASLRCLAWLCDVFIAESYRARGLGKWLVKSVISYPEIEAGKYFLLATSDAHELYRK